MPPAEPPREQDLTIDVGRLPRWVENFTARHGGSTVSGDGTSLVLNAGDGSAARIDHPWRIAPLDPDDPLADLTLSVAQTRTLVVLLVRRGGHAVGVRRGREWLVTKVGGRHVQGRTKAGGWSQQRYARRRAHQADQAWQAAADDAARILTGPRTRDLALDGLVLGGDRSGLETVLSDPRLATISALPREGWLRAVPDPRQRVLLDLDVDVLRIRLSDTAG